MANRRTSRPLACLEEATLEEAEQEAPPPNFAEAVVTQTQLLQWSTEAIARRNIEDHHPAPMEEDLLCKIERFMLLKPPTFSYSKDPLDADDWLKVIETKLDVTNCTNEECVVLALHQLDYQPLEKTTTTRRYGINN